MTQQIIERRNAFPVSLETRGDGKRMLSGYGSVFYRAGVPGTEYRMFTDLWERIGLNAFDRALREKDDVRGLFNHDPNMILGRTAAGTMQLSVDETGLRYSIELPDTQVGRDLAAAVARGDVSGSSFSFVPESVDWTKDGEIDVRTINAVRLYDTGPVTFPAYEATTAGVRSQEGMDLILAERDAWRRSGDVERISIRRRILELDGLNSIR